MNNGFSILSIEFLLIDLFIAIGALYALRYFQGLLIGVDTTTELASKDNYAFGISCAGGTLALALVLAGAVTGEAHTDLASEALSVAVYAGLGIILLKLGCIINDRIIFHRFSIKTQIREQNTAAGIVQAANLVALGSIINTSAQWVDSESPLGALVVVFLFFLAQLVLLTTTRLRGLVYRRRHHGATLQGAIENGNAALAIRYLGHVLGAALAVKAASGLVPYQLGGDLGQFFGAGAGIQSMALITLGSQWLFVSLIITIVISALAGIARHAVLRNINVIEEVDDQQNIGVAFIEATLFIAVGLIVSSLFG